MTDLQFEHFLTLYAFVTVLIPVPSLSSCLLLEFVNATSILYWCKCFAPVTYVFDWYSSVKAVLIDQNMENTRKEGAKKLIEQTTQKSRPMYLQANLMKCNEMLGISMLMLFSVLPPKESRKFAGLMLSQPFNHPPHVYKMNITIKSNNSSSFL